MADVNQNDVVTLVVRAEDGGTEDVVNVYDMAKTDATGQDATSALSDLEDWVNLVYNILATIQAVRLVYREITAYNRTQGTLLGSMTISAPTTGAGAGGSLPPGNAALMSFTTNVGRLVGRKYVGGLAAAILDTDGTLSAGSVTQLISAANTIRAPFTGTTGNWQYGIWRALTNSHVVPTGAVVGDVVAYQRRRREGRGS